MTQPGYPPHPYQQSQPYQQQPPVQHRAVAPRRWPFWVMCGWHAVVALFAAGTLKDPFAVTFAALGSGAAVDVMAAVSWWAWHGGPSRR
jgi:hypothetical protein